MKKDILGTIKSLRHIEPDKSYVMHSKKELISKLYPNQTLYKISGFQIALTTSSFAVFLLFYSFNVSPEPKKTEKLASLNQDTLVQESNDINLKSKVEEVKKRDEKNKAIDKAVQNLAFVSSPAAHAPQQTIIDKPENKIDTLLDELL